MPIIRLAMAASIAAAAGGAPSRAASASGAPRSSVTLDRAVGAGSSDSAWTACGVPLARGDDYRSQVVVTSDGTGGLYAAWAQAPPGSPTPDIFAQRLLGDGRIAPGWPDDGIPVCTAPETQMDPAICGDGEGGLYVAWYDIRQSGPQGSEPRIYALHLLADGRRANGWDIDGRPVIDAETVQIRARVAAGPAHSMYVAVQAVGSVVLQRLLPDGSRPPGWPAGGVPLGSGSFPDLTPDGAGGVFVVWAFGSASVHGTRVDSTGTVVAPWPAGGAELCRSPSSIGYPRCVFDGAGSFYIVMLSNYFAYGSNDLVVQRIAPDGVPAPGWGPGGVTVCAAAGGSFDPVIATDDGGAYVAWRDTRTVPERAFVTHVLADGSIASGWTTDGNPMSVGQTSPPDLGGDGAGGVLVAWSEPARGAIVARFAPDGTPMAGWPPGGVAPCTETPQGAPRLAPDGAGGAIVVVQDFRDTLVAGVWAMRIRPDGSTPRVVACILARAERGLVRLAWAGESASPNVTLERAAPGGAWEAVGDLSSAGGLWTYLDSDVAEGGSYRYRLQVLESSGETTPRGAVEVSVPSSLPVVLALLPNPSAGSFTASFRLRDAAVVRIDVFDVAGRRVIGRALGRLGPGLHAEPLRLDGVASPGVYVARVAIGGATLEARVVYIP